MTRLQEVTRVFDRYVKVSTVLELCESMVFECDAEGNIFNIDNPIIEKHYGGQEEAKIGHSNLVEMYEYINQNGYTRADWEGSFYDNMKVSQFVHDDIIEDLANCLPPRTWKRNVLQLGERYSIKGYATFRREYGFWYYAGIEA